MSPRDWSRRGHPEGLPTLFIDRSLGRVKVPTLLRKSGLELVTLAEHYGIPADEKVEEVTWLAETATRGWVVQGRAHPPPPGRKGSYPAPRRQMFLLHPG